MHRFFVNNNQIDNNNIYIIDKDLRHIKNVLRLKTKDRIEVSCDGINYECEILEIRNDKLIANIISTSVANNESDIQITLYQGLAKGSKMDLIIQKCVEIGVKDFYAIETERTVVKITNQKKENSKIDRWQAIAEEAAKQSKRDY
ncbi:MAG TPA: RsmE family RNA methyltransferase, partial [Tissierellaceae bacterium]|nr:RsmE family RNA methyltransferase [Tissierellaceae bacterium]